LQRKLHYTVHVQKMSPFCGEVATCAVARSCVALVRRYSSLR